MSKLSQRFDYWFSLPVATQNEIRKQLSCVSLCLCLSNISLFIALLVLSTIMLLNFSFLLRVCFLCVSWASSLFLNYCITTLSESPIISFFIFLTASHRFNHIYFTFSNVSFLRFTSLLAIFNNLLLILI